MAAQLGAIVSWLQIPLPGAIVGLSQSRSQSKSRPLDEDEDDKDHYHERDSKLQRRKFAIQTNLICLFTARDTSRGQSQSRSPNAVPIVAVVEVQSARLY